MKTKENKPIKLIKVTERPKPKPDSKRDKETVNVERR